MIHTFVIHYAQILPLVTQMGRFWTGFRPREKTTGSGSKLREKIKSGSNVHLLLVSFEVKIIETLLLHHNLVKKYCKKKSIPRGSKLDSEPSKIFQNPNPTIFQTGPKSDHILKPAPDPPPLKKNYIRIRNPRFSGSNG